ncbi:MAG TPA: circadian clock KaiB family protein [Polyangia bacterium]|jgi:circadian clock protein KaiB|nr:circadian clock KaiB family protein [Polyangia bacterium]
MVSPKNSLGAFERAAARSKAPPRYRLQLFVAGATPMSSRALANLREICEQHLHGRYELDVIDVYEHPEMAKADRIIAIPTLLKKVPAPLRRLVGDLSDRERVLIGLSIKVRAA